MARGNSGLQARDVLYGDLVPREQLLTQPIITPNIFLPEPEARLESGLEVFWILRGLQRLSKEEEKSQEPVHSLIAYLRSWSPRYFLFPEEDNKDYTTKSLDSINYLYDDYKKGNPDQTDWDLADYEWDVALRGLEKLLLSDHPTIYARKVLPDTYKRLCGSEYTERNNHVFCNHCGEVIDFSQVQVVRQCWVCPECAGN